jgi:acetyltransferase-like isoleucine patch superfamily enzyme
MHYPKGNSVTACVRLMTAFLYFAYNNCISHIPLYCVRHLYLRTALRIKIGKKSAVHMGCFITGRHITIGSHSVVNRNCYLDGRTGIEIGNNVSISPHTNIITLSHDPQSPLFSPQGENVVLSDYVWTGMRTTILPGVRLGKGCVTGAGSVVTKSFDDFSIIAGCPAKKIGRRNPDLRYELCYFPFFNGDITSA